MRYLRPIWVSVTLPSSSSGAIFNALALIPSQSEAVGVVSFFILVVYFALAGMDKAQKVMEQFH